MENMLQGKRSFFREVGLSLMLALVLCGTAFGQQMTVSGRVTSAAGDPLQGVAVRVPGTNIRTVTTADGRYTVTAPASGVLNFALIGYRAVFTNIAGRATVDVQMAEAIAQLEEVVVTGYTAQRRAEIVGAVASVNIESVSRQTSSSVLQRLAGSVAGLTVEATGSPGARSTVRVRGVSSFQNNDPLYIIDGTPVQESFINWLNPNDVASVQVLKDAAAASIYGSRANNGVIIIETKKGRPGPARFHLDVRTGVATPVRGYDDFLILDALQYHEIVKRSHENAGLAAPTNIYGNPNSPSVPKYIWPNNCTPNPCQTLDESSYVYPDRLIMPGSAGTNWWEAVFGPAFVGDYNLGVSGGGEDHAYNLSFNYLNQEGTAAFNRLQRGTARLNTEFDLGRLIVGENIAFSLDQSFGGIAGDGFGEGGFLGKNILSQPVVPIYDIKGEPPFFASGKAVGLGNNTNPLKAAWGDKDDLSRNIRAVGSVYGGLELRDQFTLRTRLGFNLGHTSFKGYTPITPENSEATFVNTIAENVNLFTDWTWSNTLNYVNTFGDHNLNVLIGQEANKSSSRFLAGTIANLVTTDINARYIGDAVGDPATKTVNSTGGTGSLLSYFGKVDYNYADKYHLSFTMRRDGSSRLGRNNRWGTFPAVGAGWRLSEESFLAGSSFFTNIMLRFGWGLTGNQNIPSGRIVSQFGGALGDVFYDIGGTDGSIVRGFRQTSLGNDSLKWEENKSVNVGLDVEFAAGKANLTVDLYRRDTDNLLFPPPVPATAGVAASPFVNIGAMRNQGIDLSLGFQSSIGEDLLWRVSVNGSHYRNKIVRIKGDTSDFFFGPISTRFGNQVINKVGHPIGSFYGLLADGFFEDAAAVAAHAAQTGAAPGRIRFRDVNGDGRVTQADRTIIGNPHPDLTAGLDLGLRWKAWDFAATFYGTFGNDIFDVQKEFYVFRNFNTNVRRDMLTDSWTPENAATAKYPRLDVSDVFSRQISSFFVEDGSYVRLRNLQLGYTLPPAWARGTRVYVQAENLFTITGYSGLDPALGVQAASGAAGDLRDQYRGVDRGTYPSNRTLSFGLSANF